MSSSLQMRAILVGRLSPEGQSLLNQYGERERGLFVERDIIPVAVFFDEGLVDSRMPPGIT